MPLSSNFWERAIASATTQWEINHYIAEHTACTTDNIDSYLSEQSDRNTSYNIIIISYKISLIWPLDFDNLGIIRHICIWALVYISLQHIHV